MDIRKTNTREHPNLRTPVVEGFLVRGFEFKVRGYLGKRKDSWGKVGGTLGKIRGITTPLKNPITSD